MSQYHQWQQQYNLSQVAYKDMFLKQYPAGTWEFGVVSVINDGYYQLGTYFVAYVWVMDFRINVAYFSDGDAKGILHFCICVVIVLLDEYCRDLYFATFRSLHCKHGHTIHPL